MLTVIRYGTGSTPGNRLPDGVPVTLVGGVELADEQPEFFGAERVDKPQSRFAGAPFDVTGLGKPQDGAERDALVAAAGRNGYGD